MIISSTTLEVYSLWTGNLSKNSLYLAIYCTVPPIVVVIIIASALYSIRGYGGNMYSISVW